MIPNGSPVASLLGCHSAGCLRFAPAQGWRCNNGDPRALPCAGVGFTGRAWSLSLVPFRTPIPLVEPAFTATRRAPRLAGKRFCFRHFPELLALCAFGVSFHVTEF